MGKNIKGLAGSTIFNQKMVEQMNGINKTIKGKHPQFIYQLKTEVMEAKFRIGEKVK